ncbi:MAG: hypothetical protein U5K55_15450 [Aliarcobacter sp.]|nr:hypothetical protein [Aliarcobacter sp.]
MKDNAIYFPYIEVPNGNWLVSTLLYWDKFSTIVPYDLRESLFDNSESLKILKNENIINTIIPMSFANDYNVTEFLNSFLIFSKKWKIKNLNYKGNNSLIHIEKLGNIVDELKSYNIVKDSEFKLYPWVEMPERLSNIFMQGLASALGEIDNISAEPVS